jgi:O-antigen ligase
MELKIKHGLANLAVYSMLGYAFFAPVSITISEIFFIITMLIVAVRIWKKELKIREIFSNPMTLPITAFVVIHFINALFGVDLKSGLIDFRKAYLILIFFTVITVFTETYTLRMGAGFFAAGAAFVGLWCTATTIVQKYIGHNVDFRASSFSGTYMMAGGMLMMGLITAAGIVIYRLKNENKNRVPAMLYVAAFILCGTGLLGTFTRSSWIGGVAGVLLLAFMTEKKYFVSAIIAIIVVAGLFWNTSFMKRFKESFDLKRGNSQSERIFMWESGLKMIKDRPIIGIGTGNVDKVYTKYRNPQAFETDEGHLHNDFIQIAVIDGLPGLVAFLWIFATFWIELYKAIKTTKNTLFRYFVISALCVNIGFFLNGFFEYNFFSSQVALIFWYLMGLAFTAIKLEKKASPQAQ